MDRKIWAEEKRERILFSMREDKGDGYKFGVEVPAGAESDLWDCSEKIEDAFSDANITIPDGAQAQFDYCVPVAADSDEPCDLGFLWSAKRNMIGHVFMFTGKGTVIHAVAGRGLVEDPEEPWLKNQRYRGRRRHPCFIPHKGGIRK